MVFTCTRGGFNHICLMDISNGGVRQLTDGELNDYYPSPGVDGYVYFASQRSLPFRLYRVPYEGGLPEAVADTAPGEHSAPELSPDGLWLVFAADVDTGLKLIYRVHPDGTGLQALVGFGYNVDPTWSPDGTQIAFGALTVAGDGVQLFVLDLINATVAQVTFGVEGIGGRSAWSPDGRFLTYYAGPKGDKDIFRVELATGQIVQLTDGGNNTGPTWSPDGSWIAFSSMRDGDFEIYVIRPDGRDLLQLTYNSAMDDWQPRWGR